MLKKPEKIDLIEFFGAVPQEDGDGYWCYEVIDPQGIKLLFSWNEIERSIQASLEISNQMFYSICSELALSIEIKKDKTGSYIECVFNYENAKLTIIISTTPFISIKSSSLEN